MHTAQRLVLVERQRGQYSGLEPTRTISSSRYSLKTSRVDRSVPLKTVGSSENVHQNPSPQPPIRRHTGYDSQLAPKVGETDLGDVDTVNDDTTLRGFYEAEEGQSQRALARACAPKDANLLAGADFEGEIVEDVWQVGLYDGDNQHPDMQGLYRRCVQHNG